MSIINIISAIGNTKSQYPLIVRDCGIEVPSKIILTYNQNKKESKEVAKLAARERFLDEYAVSAVWLGMIPLVERIADFFIRKRGYSPDVSLKLISGTKLQNINENIKNFKGKVPENIIKELKTFQNTENIKVFKKCLASKFIAATTIPIAFMGFILPKLIFASSAKKIEKQRQKEAQINRETKFQKAFEFMNNKQVSFKGNIVSTITNFSTVDKMAITDGGYAVGRVATARNKNEAIDVGFKMIGMMFLNFVAPGYIAKYLDKIAACFTGINVSLDPILLDNASFIEKIKTNSLKLPSSSSEKDILEFIDNNTDSIFVKYAKKFDKIKLLKIGDKTVRDPRFFVDTKEIDKLKNSIESFRQAAITSKNINSYVRKAKTVKCLNILLNIGLSSFLLAYALPKTQFAFRKLITGSDLEPGLAKKL